MRTTMDDQPFSLTEIKAKATQLRDRGGQTYLAQPEEILWLLEKVEALDALRTRAAAYQREIRLCQYAGEWASTWRRFSRDVCEALEEESTNGS